MIDILCPVLGRSERTEPFARSLAENTVNPYRLVFVCTPKDNKKIVSCQEHGEILLARWPARAGDFAKKVNYGFEQTENEWVMCAADDLRFEQGWDKIAIACSKRARRLVVGTNDLHNPLVKRGQHSTHPLFHRSYVEKYGSATIDGTGHVFCELYDHQFVDNEFCDTAKARGEWVFCKASIVEHLHPYWELAPYDDTYRKALRNGVRDQRLYVSRSRKFQRRVRVRR